MSVLSVIYDYQIFSEQAHGGISRYFVELCRQLSAMDGIEAEIFARFHKNRYLDGSLCPYGKSSRVPPRPFPAGVLRRVNCHLFERRVRKRHPAIIHRTYHHSGKTFGSGTRMVTTVYDMTHELFPQHFPHNSRTAQRKARDIGSADLVLCISENTRRDLREILKVPEEKSQVVHLGVSPLEFDWYPDLGTRKPFILYVGARGAYKNFFGLLQAYSSSSDLQRDFGILCFGGGPFSQAEYELMSELNIGPNRIMQVSGDDRWLAACYRNANLFVMPSMYEGFGLPVLEAMTLACPVACSRRSSLPEIAGDAAVYFDPDSVEEMRAVIESLLYDDERINRMKDLGRVHAAEYTWRKCADETLAAYRRCV
jgi:glycosyltransferase involved in cell wall biosynthesis